MLRRMMFSTCPRVLDFSDVREFCWLWAVQSACTAVPGAMSLQAELAAARCGSLPCWIPYGSGALWELHGQQWISCLTGVSDLSRRCCVSSTHSIAYQFTVLNVFMIFVHSSGCAVILFFAFFFMELRHRTVSIAQTGHRGSLSSWGECLLWRASESCQLVWCWAPAPPKQRNPSTDLWQRMEQKDSSFFDHAL